MVGCFTWILNKSLYLGQVWIYIYIYFVFFSWTYFFQFYWQLSGFIFISFVFVDSWKFSDFAKRLSFAGSPGLCLGGPFCLSGLSQHGSPLFFRPFFNELHGCSEKNNCRHWSRHGPSRVKAACCGQETHRNFAPFFWKRSMTHGRDFFEDS